MDKLLSRDLLFDFKNGNDCIPPDCSQRITDGVKRR
jgi:hypothetical protein